MANAIVDTIVAGDARPTSTAPAFASMSIMINSAPCLAAAIGLAAAFACFAPASGAEIVCEGSYAKHLQGVCRGDDGALYWCFTDELVKTDAAGARLKTIPVASHHGDLCCHAGRVYVAVNLGKFNRPAGEADSWVYVYEADDLDFVAKHAVPEVVHGAGGMAWQAGKFFVVGGLPEGIDENYAYEYDEALRFVRRHTIPSRFTLMGIQTAAFDGRSWWLGCYGKPAILLRASAGFGDVRRYESNAAYGIVPQDDGTLLVARDRVVDKRHVAKLVACRPDDKRGLVEVVAEAKSP